MKGMNKKVWLRVLYVIVGFTILAIGLAFLRYAALGLDPYGTLIIGLTRQFDAPFGTVLLLVNLSMLVVVFFLDRRRIGFGTLYAMVVVGYTSDAVLWLISAIPVFEQFSIGIRIVSFALGLPVLLFGVAICIEANMGFTPYDMLGVIIAEKIKRPHWFRWIRICTDALCVASGALLRSDIGAGTLLAVLLAGPLIAFFRKVLVKTKPFQIIQGN